MKFESGVTGVIYYKLDPEKNGYEGDVLKNCGLTGPEVDANFHFLRGYDIIDGELSGDTLVLYRVNGNTIEISGFDGFSDHDCCISGITYSADTGTLYIDYCGDVHEVSGFFTMDDIKYDCTLQINENGELGVRSDVLFSGITSYVDDSIAAEREERKEMVKLLADSLVEIEESIDEVGNILNDRIEDEIAERENADNQLSQLITEVDNNRKGDRYQLEQALESEKEERESEDSVLNGKIDAEKSARENKDNALNSKINSEIAAVNDTINEKNAERIAREDEILGIANAIKYQLDAKIDNINSGFTEDIQNLRDADEAMSNAIVQEKNERTAADNELNNKIDSNVAEINDEIGELRSSDVNLSIRLRDENIQRRTDVERLTNSIIAEAEERANADNELANSISDINSRINEEIQNRTTSENEIRNDYNSKVSALTEAVEDVRDSVSGLSTDTNERIDNLANAVNSALTEEKTDREAQYNDIVAALSAETRERISADTAIMEAVKDASLTEDVALNTTSPLFTLLNGIWENNTVPSGTTFTEFVKKLFSGDERMLYYNTIVENGYDGLFKDGRLDTSAVNSVSPSWNDSGQTIFTFQVNTGDEIILIILPKGRVLTNVVNNTYNQRILKKFKPEDVMTDNAGVCTMYKYVLDAPQPAETEYVVTVS